MTATSKGLLWEPFVIMRGKIFCSLLLAAGLALASVVPIHFMPWVAWHSEVPIFAAVLLVATWASLSALIRRGASGRTPVPFLVFGFLGIGALAVLQAAIGVIGFAGDAWVILLYALLCAASFLLGYGQSQESGQADAAVEGLAWTLLLSGIGCAFIALIQALDIWPTSEWIARTPTLRRSGSNLAQPNQMATLVLMAVASVALLYERGRIGPAVGTVLGTVLAVGLATTESRTGALSALAMATWWLCRGYTSRLRGSSICVALALAVIVCLIWPPLIEAYHGIGGAELARVNTKAGLRLVVWPQLIESAIQRPWFGWGLGQTSTALTSVVYKHDISEPYTYAHNIVLELMVGVGAPMTLLLLGCAVVWALRRWSARNEVAGWYCLALWVPLSTHALLEFPYSYAYLLAPATFALGLVERKASPDRPREFSILLVSAVAVFTSALGLWSLVEYLKIEEDFRVVRFESARIGATPTAYARPSIHLLTQLGAMLVAARIVPRPGMLSSEVAFTGQVAARFPWPALQNRYALALALNGQPAAAEKELRVILAMHGEGLFREVRLNWKSLQTQKYPELGKLHMPEGSPPVSAMR